MEHELRGHLETVHMPWLIVSLVPDLPGDLELTHVLRQQFSHEILQKDVRICVGIGISFMRAHVGRRRLVADGSRHGEEKSECAAAEFHCDGAGAFGQYVPDLRAESSAPDRTTSQEQLVSDEGLILAVMSGLHHLGSHARDRAATAGSALVRATPVPSDGCTIEIGHNRRHFRDSRSSVKTTKAVTADSVADIDELAEQGSELVATTARLVDDLAQCFGIAELGQVTKDGEFRLPYWGAREQPHVRSWAEAHGISVTQDVLD